MVDKTLKLSGWARTLLRIGVKGAVGYMAFQQGEKERVAGGRYEIWYGIALGSLISVIVELVQKFTKIQLFEMAEELAEEITSGVAEEIPEEEEIPLQEIPVSEEIPETPEEEEVPLQEEVVMA